jgi:hypothetical protein
MAYRIGFDGAASAELTHMLRAVQNGLNGSGANLLMHVRGEADTASAASAPCVKYTKDCINGVPIEPPNFVVIHTALFAGILVVSVLVSVGFGFALGRKSTTPNVKN